MTAVPLTPLLPVVELGLDVIALRERDKRTPGRAGVESLHVEQLMPGFIHSSPAMTSLVEEVYKIRSSDVTVLVTGESGTVKSLCRGRSIRFRIARTKYSFRSIARPFRRSSPRDIYSVIAAVRLPER
jgi:DNA-binding NtrC family response regulator